MTAPLRQSTFQVLLCRVDEARAELQSIRSTVDPKRSEVTAAQQRFHRSLEAYAAAAEAEKVPVPHRLRVELVVYRALDQSN
jgi:hypothetical protein